MERTENGWTKRTRGKTERLSNSDGYAVRWIRGKIEGKQEGSTERLSKIAVAAAVGSALVALAALLIGIL